MRASAFELIVKHAMLVQDSVKNIGRDSARGEAGHLGRRGKSRGSHAEKTFVGRKIATDAAAEPEWWHGNMPNVRIVLFMNRLVCKHLFEKCALSRTQPPSLCDSISPTALIECPACLDLDSGLAYAGVPAGSNRDE